MSDEEALGGWGGDTPIMAVDDRIKGLEHQMGSLTQMIQTCVKLETVDMEQRESVKAALGGLDGGPVFNEAVVAQYHQAKQQQIAEKIEVQQLQNHVWENVETSEMVSLMYLPFKFSQVSVEERNFVRLLAKDLTEVDWSPQSVKNWVTKLQRPYDENFIVSRTVGLKIWCGFRGRH